MAYTPVTTGWDGARLLCGNHIAPSHWALSSTDILKQYCVVLLILSFVHHHTVQSRLSIVLRRTKVLLWLLSSACCFCCFNSCASLPLDVDQLIIIEIIFPQSFHVLTILISYQYYFHGWFFVLIIFLCIFKILSSFCMLCMNSGPNFEELLIKFNFLFSGNLNLNCCWDMLVIWEVI